MGLLQKKAREKGAEARLKLAAFGKHPGWTDHMEGIGMDTGTLAELRQTLYVSGIGGQDDSGAWDKLSAEKRLEGYNHTFLQISPGHMVLGLMWSSSDRKGRSKYPMIVCVDGEGTTLEFLLAKGLPELARLRAACKATASSDQVISECRQTQEQLRVLATAPDTTPPVSVEQRRRFLENQHLGPDKIGILRLLHELTRSINSTVKVKSGSTTLADFRAFQMRVPLAANSGGESLILWSYFFACLWPANLPLLLIYRHGTDWLDAIVGHSSTDDFFCLQASASALPMVTTIPYELSDGLRPLLQNITAMFLVTMEESAPNAGAATPVSAPPPSTPKAPSLAFATAGEPGTAAPRPRRWWLYLLLLLLAAGAGAAAWIFCLNPAGKPASQPNAAPPIRAVGSAAAVASRPPEALTDTAREAQECRSLVQLGKVAMDEKKYQAAAENFAQALKIRPDDAAISNYLGQAKSQLAEIDFTQALAAGKQDLAAGHVDEAQKKLAEASQLKPNDPRAQELAVQISQHQQALAKDQYAQTLVAARQALAAGNPDSAIDLSRKAQLLKPGDTGAAPILREAEEMKKAEATYQSAMSAAQAAFDHGDYATAIKEADTALSAKTANAGAAKLKASAQKQLDAALEQNRKYQEAMAGAHQAYAVKDYATAISRLNLALTSRPADAEAANLKREAETHQSEQQAVERSYAAALADARAALAEGNYANAATQLASALAQKPDDPTARELQKTIQAAQAASKTQPAAMRSSAAAKTESGPVTASASLAECDQTLRNLMIELHVTPAKTNTIQTNGGTTTPMPQGHLSQRAIDWYNRSVDALQSNYKSHAWLDPEREKDIKLLKGAIRFWNE